MREIIERHAGIAPSLLGAIRPALALLLTITTGCAAVDPEREPDGRLAQVRQVLQEARSTAAEVQDQKFRNLVLYVIALWQVEAKDVPAAIVVEGILHHVDLESGLSKQRQIRWRADPRTLQEWIADGGTALNAALAQACEALAERIVSETKHFWRNR